MPFLRSKEADNHRQSFGNKRNVERYIHSFVTRLRHYVFEHQKELDTSVPLLTFVYDAQMREAKGKSSFNVILKEEAPSAVSA